jgi:hypothetical protein
MRKSRLNRAFRPAQELIRFGAAEQSAAQRVLAQAIVNEQLGLEGLPVAVNCDFGWSAAVELCQERWYEQHLAALPAESRDVNLFYRCVLVIFIHSVRASFSSSGWRR